MAIMTPGTTVSEIRGSIAGQTFSRNRFGMYVRQRSVPVNPNSPSQAQARGRVATCSTYWRDTLTQAQRDAWDAYAAATSWKNALGMDISLTGLNMFMRTNQAALLCGASIITAAPATPGIPDEPVDWTPTADSSGNEFSIAYTWTPDTDDQFWLFFASRPYAASKVFFDGPWRFLGSLAGDSGTPPATPVTFAYPWTLVAGQRVWIYARRLDPDGRLSEPFRQTVLAT